MAYKKDSKLTKLGNVGEQIIIDIMTGNTNYKLVKQGVGKYNNSKAHKFDLQFQKNGKIKNIEVKTFVAFNKFPTFTSLHDNATGKLSVHYKKIKDEYGNLTIVFIDYRLKEIFYIDADELYEWHILHDNYLSGTITPLDYQKSLKERYNLSQPDINLLLNYRNWKKKHYLNHEIIPYGIMHEWMRLPTKYIKLFNNLK